MVTPGATPLQPSTIVVDPALSGDSLIGTRLNNIELVKRLDAGAMGTIYLGVNRELDKQYAIKVSTHSEEPGLEGRSLQEAKALSRLDHPNIVQVFDAWTLQDGRLAIVMPLLSGRSLLGHLDLQPDGTSRRLPLRETLLIGLQLASGLEHAHAHGLVHRDLKPGNVFVTQREVEIAGFKTPELKILDFGLVRMGRAQWSPLPAQAVPTPAGPAATIAVGTPEYVSPEQASGSPRVDGRADLYSLGALLFELLAGRLPFVTPPGLSRQEQAVALLRQHQVEPAPKVSVWEGSTPRQLDELIAQLLEKSPDRRPASARVVEARLREILAALPRDQALKPAPRRARTVAVLLTVTAALGALAWFAVQPAPTQPLPVEPAPVEHTEHTEPPSTAAPNVAPQPEAPVADLPPPVLPAATPKTTEPQATRRAPVKTANKKTRRAPAAPAAACTPDEQWRNTLKANLKELEREALADSARYAVFKAGEKPLSALIKDATTSEQCRSANLKFNALQAAVTR